MKTRLILVVTLISTLALLTGFASRGATISVSCAPVCVQGEPAVISGSVEHVNERRIGWYRIRIHPEGTADWYGNILPANMQADGTYSLIYNFGTAPGMYDIELVYFDHNPVTLVVETTVQVVP